jgi:hypothetical protein
MDFDQTWYILCRVWNPIDFQGHRSKVKVRGSNFYLVNIRINILQWILVKLGKYLCPSENLKPYWFSRSKGQGHRVKFFTVNTTINIGQWILIKLGTYLVLRRVWNILRPWKSIGFQIAKYVPSLVKIHWRTLILECSQGCYAVTNLTWWPWPLTLKINRVSDSLTDKVCTKFYQNPLKDVYSRVFTRILFGKNLTRWPWKSIGFQILLRTKYVPSLVKIHWRMLILCNFTLGLCQLCLCQYNICIFIIPSLTKLRRDVVTLPSVLPSVRNILVNTLESTSFNGFWPNLVHI